MERWRRNLSKFSSRHFHDIQIPKCSSVVVEMSPDGNNNENDPLKSLFAKPQDSLQSFLNPLKEGKKMLVKSLAGDYNEEATLAKLKGLIDDNRILMLSFTT